MPPNQNPDPSLRAIFNQALDRENLADRAAYLDAACGADAALRERVERLLRAHSEAAGFFSHPDAGLDPRHLATLLADPLPEGERPGDRIGRYKLLEKIGTGGCGVVYMAEQEEPVRRRVALKVIKLGMDTRQVIARFEAERQAIALMEHANIARVLDAGATETGRPFFVMELVRGIKITDYCDQQKLSPRERLKLFIPICQAVQHAHQKGIVHRDLKPSNLLVTTIDGHPVPKVIDFGIAKATSDQQLTDKTVFTSFAHFIGTPAYMSPEQAELSGVDIDTRSDIYSLGVVLYELLTGRAPFDRQRLGEAALDEIRRIIREEDPPRPSLQISTLGAALSDVSALRGTEPQQLSRLVRGELDWIVMKAMEKDRGRRYQTANAVVRDLERYLADEQVEACPPSAGYRLRKFARRHRKGLTAAALIALALLGGTTIASWQAIRATQAEGLATTRLSSEQAARVEADEAREQEETMRERAVELAEANRQQVYAARINLAQQYYEQAEIANAVALLSSLAPSDGEEDLRGFEWHYLWRLCHGERLTLAGHVGPVYAAAFSPSGETVATGGRDGTARIWRSDTGQEEARFEAGGDVRGVAYSPDGSLLAVAVGTRGKPGAALLIDLLSGTERHRIEGFAHPVMSVAFSPDGSTLATGTAQLAYRGGTPLTRLLWIDDGRQIGEAQLWNVGSGTLQRALPGATGGILSLAFSPDGSAVAASSWDTAVRVWELADLKDPKTLTDHRGYVWSIAFSPDGATLASVGGKWDGAPEARLWEWQTSTTSTAWFADHASGATAVAFSPDGETLATAGWDRTVRMVDRNHSRASSNALRGHTSYVSSVAFSPDGSTVLTSSYDGTAKLWSVDEPLDRTKLQLTDLASYSIAFAPDGKSLAAAGLQIVSIVDTASGERLIRLVEQPAQSLTTYSVDGKSLAVAGFAHPAGSVRVYDTESWQPRFANSGHADKTVWALAFSPDGKTLATGGADNALRLWDAHSGAPLGSYHSLSHHVRSLAFSPDGKLLAACSWWRGEEPLPLGSEYQVRIWNAASGEQLFDLETGWSSQIAFSPDSRILATTRASSFGNKDIELWDLATGQRTATLPGNLEPIYDLTFAPDGRTLASAGWDGAIRLWHIASAQPLIALKAPRGVAYTVAFSPDGRTLASGSGYRQGGDDFTVSTVLLWHAATPEEALADTLNSAELPPRSPRIAAFPGDQLDQLFDRAQEHATAGREKRAEAIARGALRRLDSLEATRSSDARLWFHRGRFMHTLGDYDAAIAGYSRALELATGHYDPRLLLELRASANASSGRYRQALDDYYQLGALAAEDAGLLNRLAWRLVSYDREELRDAVQAVKWASQAVALAPDNMDFRTNLALAQYKAGSDREALETLDAIAALRDGSPSLFHRFLRALATAQLGQLEEARRVFAETIDWMESQPKPNEESLRLRTLAAKDLAHHFAKAAFIHYEAAAHLKALETLDTAATFIDESPPLFHRFLRALATCRLGRLEEARRIYVETIDWMEAQPSLDEESLRLRSVAAIELGQAFAEAGAELEPANAAAPALN
jgi:eukaryotic-like serine/threonine-protein kinase